MTPEKLRALANRIKAGQSVRGAARAEGVPGTTARRALGEIKNRLRTKDEFLVGGGAARTPPRRVPGPWAWDLARIRSARDAQLRGDFEAPVAMAKSMRTDDAIFVAYHNRIAPVAAIGASLNACDGARGESVAKRAARDVIVPRTTLQGIVGTLADHGLAVGYNKQEVSDDGTRVEFRHTEWPLQFVKWNTSKEILETRVDSGPMVPIVHGDGFWTVYQKFDLDPWTQEACILPACLLVWAAHTGAIQDWAAGARSHGQVKLMGKMPEGFALQTSEGTLTPEAEQMLGMLQELASGEAGAGLSVFGSETDLLANGSSAWQVFSEFASNREKAAARIYLRTDAILGSVGGAPGVDISALFSVASAVIQGDFTALASGLNVGVYQPWAAMNFGSSRYAPSVEFKYPDPDASRKSEEEGSKMERLLTTIDGWRKQGFVVTQAEIVALAKTFGVATVPVLQPAAEKTVPLALAPTDMAKVVRVDEARGSLGLRAIGGVDGAKFLPELEADSAAPAPAARRALAAPREYERADDGKFGSGAGSSGSPGAAREGESDAADGDESEPDDGDEAPERDPVARHEIAKERLAAAKAAHEEATQVAAAAESDLAETQSEALDRGELNAKKREASKAERAFERADGKHFDAYQDAHPEHFEGVPPDAKSQVAAQQRVIAAYEATPDAQARRAAFRDGQDARESVIDSAEAARDELPDKQRAADQARAKAVRAARAVAAHEREVARTGKKIDADGDGKFDEAEDT